jgi:O-antigen ligase
MLFPLAMYFLLDSARGKSFLKVMAWLAIPLVGYGLYISSSRGALLSIAVFMVGFFLTLRGLRGFFNVIAIFGLLVITAYGSLVFFASAEMRDYTLERLGIGAYSLNNFSAGRLDHWRIYFASILEHPIIGVGYKAAYANTGLAVDNSFLSVAAEMGLFTLVAFIAMWIFMLRGALNGLGSIETRTRSALVFGMALGCFAYSLTVDIYTQWLSFPIFLFLIYFNMPSRKRSGAPGAR